MREMLMVAIKSESTVMKVVMGEVEEEEEVMLHVFLMPHLL